MRNKVSSSGQEEMLRMLSEVVLPQKNMCPPSKYKLRKQLGYVCIPQPAKSVLQLARAKTEGVCYTGFRVYGLWVLGFLGLGFRV